MHVGHDAEAQRVMNELAHAATAKAVSDLLRSEAVKLLDVHRPSEARTIREMAEVRKAELGAKVR